MLLELFLSFHSLVILNFQLKWFAEYQNKQKKILLVILPEVFYASQIYKTHKKYPLLMCAGLKEENRCQNICVVSHSKLLA